VIASDGNQGGFGHAKKPESVAEFARIRAGQDPNSGEFGYTGGCGRGTDWQFHIAAARRKLKSLYPKIKG
jgi:hypothetical protein